MQVMQTYDELVKQAGGKSAMARLLAVKRQAVQQWAKSGIPHNRLIQLMQMKPAWFKKQ